MEVYAEEKRKGMGDQSVKTNFKLLIGLNFSPADIIYLPPIESLQKIHFCELLNLPLSLCLFLFLWLRQSHDTQLSIFWGRGRLGVARFIHSNQDKGLHSEKKFTLSKCANQNHVGFSFFKRILWKARHSKRAYWPTEVSRRLPKVLSSKNQFGNLTTYLSAVVQTKCQKFWQTIIFLSPKIHFMTFLWLLKHCKPSAMLTQDAECTS